LTVAISCEPVSDPTSFGNPAATVVEIQARELVLTTEEGTAHTAAYAVIPGDVLKWRQELDGERS